MSERLRDGYFAIGMFAGICLALAGVLLWETLGAVIHCGAKAQCMADMMGTSTPPRPGTLAMIQRLVSSEDSLATWLATFISLAAVVVSAVAVTFVKKTLDATLRAASASTEATKAMVEANRMQRAEQRPWCVITWDTACELIEEPNDLFRLRWNFQLTNKGKCAAHNVRFRFNVYRSGWGGARSNVEDVLKKGQRASSSGQVLFPGEGTEFRHFESWNMTGHIQGEQAGTLFVCGCVIYDIDETGREQGHEAIALVARRRKGEFGPFATRLLRIPEFTLRA